MFDISGTMRIVSIQFKLLGKSVYPLTMVCLEPNRSYGVPCRMDEKTEASYRFRMTEKKEESGLQTYTMEGTCSTPQWEPYGICHRL